MLFSNDRRGRRSAEVFGGVLNLLVGAACLAGGLSGAIRLLGTGSGTPLVILGAVLVVVGGLRVWRWWVHRSADAAEAAEAVQNNAPPEEHGGA